tara:strand:+ start:627 stop:830 length:204 start_codon:yes stop_codon:yes gene_type:complete
MKVKLKVLKKTKLIIELESQEEARALLDMCRFNMSIPKLVDDKKGNRYEIIQNLLSRISVKLQQLQP